MAGFPLRFDSEVVRVKAVGESLEVDANYFLACTASKSPAITLFYPYPTDERLGGARSIRLEGRPRGGDWTPLRFEEAKQAPGARWWIPLNVTDTLEVHAVYRQAIRGPYMRYIVTSTKAWGRPLRTARFEITLPDGAEPVAFSFPFVRAIADSAPGTPVYVYHAVDFLPDRDITVEWLPAGQ